MTNGTGLLLDSNIIIYSTSPDQPTLAQFIQDRAPVVSAISYVETLGFHRLAERERTLLELFFATTPMVPIDRSILDRAVALRQRRKIFARRCFDCGHLARPRPDARHSECGRLPLD